MVSSYANHDDRTIYSVIVNNVGQYSLWPAREGLPAGWTGVGKIGTRQECFDYISGLMTAAQSQPGRCSVAGEGSE